MAEQRIESGRAQIAGVGGAPLQRVAMAPVDYVGVRAEGQAAGQLSQMLERMSSTLFKEAGELRQKEGLEFVATNPVTTEQLEAAKGGNMGPLDLGKGFSIFDQAVRKARAMEISGHFEMEGRNELTKLLVDVETGKATSADVETKIKAFTDGYTKTISTIDPEASFKFRATMATQGNAVLKSAYELELKRAKNQRVVKFDMDFDNQMRLLEAAVSQNPNNIEGIADLARKNIGMQSMIFGDASIQKDYSTKFEAGLRNAKINALTKVLTSDEFMVNPDDTLAKIRKGEIGNLSPVLQRLINSDFDAVAKVTANFMVAANQRETLAKQKSDRNKRDGEAAAINLLEQIFPLSEGDPKRKVLVGQLMDLPPGSVPIGTIKDLLDVNVRSNPMVLGNVYNQIDKGVINTKEQIDAYVGKGVGGQDYVALIKYLNADDRRDKRDLQQGISRLAGIPVIPGQMIVLDPKGAEFQRRQELESEALRIQADAAKGGISLTTSQILQQLETNIAARRKSEAAVSAAKALEFYEKKDWIGGPITRETLAALERKAGTDKNKLNELRRIKTLLDQKEGIAPGGAR